MEWVVLLLLDKKHEVRLRGANYYPGSFPFSCKLLQKWTMKDPAFSFKVQTKPHHLHKSHLRPKVNTLVSMPTPGDPVHERLIHNGGQRAVSQTLTLKCSHFELFRLYWASHSCLGWCCFKSSPVQHVDQTKRFSSQLKTKMEQLRLKLVKYFHISHYFTFCNILSFWNRRTKSERTQISTLPN